MTYLAVNDSKARELTYFAFVLAYFSVFLDARTFSSFGLVTAGFASTYLRRGVAELIHKKIPTSVRGGNL